MTSALIKSYPSHCYEEFLTEYNRLLNNSGNSLYHCLELPWDEVMLQRRTKAKLIKTAHP